MTSMWGAVHLLPQVMSLQVTGTDLSPHPPGGTVANARSRTATPHPALNSMVAMATLSGVCGGEGVMIHWNES